MNHFCRQASRLESDALERRLSMAERCRLWLHLRVCAACRNYRRELQLMRALFDRIQAQPDSPIGGMSADERTRIRDALRRVAGEEP